MSCQLHKSLEVKLLGRTEWFGVKLYKKLHLLGFEWIAVEVILVDLTRMAVD